MIDIRSKYLLIQNPHKESFLMFIRKLIAIIIYPRFANQNAAWYADFHTHEYMLKVHKSYQKELSQLNKAIIRQQKKIKEYKLLLQHSLEDSSDNNVLETLANPFREIPCDVVLDEIIPELAAILHPDSEENYNGEESFTFPNGRIVEYK